MWSRPGIRGLQRVQGKRVLDIRKQQLLVLLLVVNAKFDPGQQRRIDCGGVQQGVQPLVDAVAIVEDLVDRRAGQQPTLGTSMTRAH